MASALRHGTGAEGGPLCQCQRRRKNKGVNVSVIYYLIICRSLTYAQRTARILERAGISGHIMRAPKLISKEGCGYCVKLSERRLTDALRVLQREGMPPRQVYLQDAEGIYSEVQP